MTASQVPPWQPWLGAFGGAGSWRAVAGPFGDPDIRLSDAERSEVADLLSKHYGEGRLDEAEFNDRLGRTMAAKTRGELRGLFDDLPPLTPVVAARSQSRGFFQRPILMAVVALFVLSAVSSLVLTPHIPWLLIGLIGFFVWRRSHRHHHHHHIDTHGRESLKWL